MHENLPTPTNGHQTMNRVFHFSGGRSSAYMVIHNYEPGDLVIFCDTGREHEGTYKFIDTFEVVENIPVIRLQHEGGWDGFMQKWNKGKNIPNRAKRECTIQLKVKTARRYLRSLGWMRYTQFVGFRGDEQKRILGYKHYWQQVTTEFPMNKAEITKRTILEVTTNN